MTTKESQWVELIVLNKPGVLGRVAGHIRREGWNIKHLSVDEDKKADGISPNTSTMEIEIEGKHTKLAQVMDRLLNLDFVVSIGMIQNGKKIVRHRPKEELQKIEVTEAIAKAPPKKNGVFRRKFQLFSLNNKI